MSIKPPHYTQYTIEPIDYIESQRYNFSQGNIIKYITRYKQKDGLKDLQKAEFYCQRQLTPKYRKTITTKEFCEKNNLEPRIAKFLQLVSGGEYQQALEIIEELKKEYK